MNQANRDRVIFAGAICDAIGNVFRPGVLRLRGNVVVAVGTAQMVCGGTGVPPVHRPEACATGGLRPTGAGERDPKPVRTGLGSPGAARSPVESVEVIDLPDRLILPGLVNAHAHLDLSHIGPVEPCGEFSEWVEVVRSRRCYDEDGIRAAVQRGVELSRAGGTAIIGDIAGIGSLVPVETLAESQLRGVSFVEFFGLGASQQRTIEAMRAMVGGRASGVGGQRSEVNWDGPAALTSGSLGLQPHAPYSAGLDLYQAATQLAREHNLPLATHLAETLAEIEFTRHGTGPLVDLIRRIGKWDDSIRPSGLHPVEHILPALRQGPWLVAHVNYAENSHLDLLAETGATVVYCPRASAYFGHAGHRYRAMIERGVRVALGTDSILCLDTPDRLSILDEMSLLHRRDGADPLLLLRMATVNGAIALGFDPALVTFEPGPIAGLIAVGFDPQDATDPLTQVLAGPRAAISPL